MGRGLVPAHVRENWRPYTVGHWVYTDDYGWYWISDPPEASWGWVVYHYGRWVLDPDLGWVWIPGDEWGPAWVTWRRGHSHIGWAPLPPDRLIVEYRNEPQVWIFVRSREFTAPNIVRVLERREPAILRETVVVNRTLVVHERGPAFAVNPGIEPAVVASITHRSLHIYRVRPHVIAGTARIPNAVEISAGELRGRNRPQIKVSAERTSTTIRSEKNVPQPQALGKNKNGRLGNRPPKAARKAAQQIGTTHGKAAARSANQPRGKGSEQNLPKAAPTGKAAEQQKPGKAARQSKNRETSGKAVEDRKPPPQRHGKAARKTNGKAAAERRHGREIQSKAAPGAQERHGKAAEHAAPARRHRRPETTGNAPHAAAPRHESRRPSAGPGPSHGRAAASYAPRHQAMHPPRHESVGRGEGATHPQAAAPRTVAPHARAHRTPEHETTGSGGHGGGHGGHDAAPQHKPGGG
jgi:hypothetical protein